MHPVFVPIFEQEVTILSQNNPYSWIRGLMTDIATRHIIRPMILRADGELFLLGNMGGLIVLPWDGVHGPGHFRQTHIRLLADDMDAILREAARLTLQKRTNEVSARSLLEVTARMTPPLATLSLDIWGP